MSIIEDLNGETITVPILKNFDRRQVIGEATILVSELGPPMNFCFSIGYKVLDAEIDEQDEVIETKIEFRCLSKADDDAYYEYLKTIKK